MKIAILGAGAMGSVYGAALSRYHEIWMLDALPERVASIQKDGLCIEQADHTIHSYNVHSALSGSNIGKVDILIVFVKGRFTHSAVQQNLRIIGNKTVIMSLQNGYGNHEEILRACPNARLLLGITMHGATMQPNGVVFHAAEGNTELGAYQRDETNATFAREIVSTLIKCGLTASYSENIYETIWRKLIVNAGINGIGALLGVKNDFIFRNASSSDALRMIVREATEVAGLIGCTFDFDELESYVMRIAEITAENKASMLQDIENRRPTESHFIYGAIARTAHAHGSRAPLCDLMHALITARESSSQQQIGGNTVEA